MPVGRVTVDVGLDPLNGARDLRQRGGLDLGRHVADVEPGEILVAPFTDPGWASVMFPSAALVVDIGGALSHAAVVARELGMPCVVNTQSGTRAIRSGDRIQVDGTTGIGKILNRKQSREERP